MSSIVKPSIINAPDAGSSVSSAAAAAAKEEGSEQRATDRPTGAGGGEVR